MATYSDYIVDAASKAEIFGGECLTIAVDFAASVPALAGDVAAAMADYTAAAAVAASQITQQASYEAYQATVNAASRLAETLEHTAAAAPSYLSLMAAAAADYTEAAAAAAVDFLENGVPSPNIVDWIQVQDDGVYVSGDGGMSVNDGVSNDWSFIPPPKYPGDIPLVPPQNIRSGYPKIEKIQPHEKTNPHGCLNKSVPTLGEIFRVQPGSMGADIDVLYWDNIGYRQMTQTFDTDARTRNFFAGTPCAMPSLSEIALTLNIPKGRYAVLFVNHNSAIVPPGLLPEYYTMVEGWRWVHRYGNYPKDTLKEHGDEYYECLQIEYGSYDGEFFHPPDYTYVPGWSMFEGEGHAVNYTSGRIGLKYIGAYADVEETPVYAAMLASVGVVDAFRNAVNMLFLPEQRS